MLGPWPLRLPSAHGPLDYYCAIAALSLALVHSPWLPGNRGHWHGPGGPTGPMRRMEPMRRMGPMRRTGPMRSMGPVRPMGPRAPLGPLCKDLFHFGNFPARKNISNHPKTLVIIMCSCKRLQRKMTKITKKIIKQQNLHVKTKKKIKSREVY